MASSAMRKGETVSFSRRGQDLLMSHKKTGDLIKCTVSHTVFKDSWRKKSEGALAVLASGRGGESKGRWCYTRNQGLRPPQKLGKGASNAQ